MNMKLIAAAVLLLGTAACGPNSGNSNNKGNATDTLQDKVSQLRKKVNHIIVIYQENWSFDGLYGEFPGANNLSNADARQVDKDGKPLTGRIYIMKPGPTARTTGAWVADPRYEQDTIYAGKPYDMARFISADLETNDITHLFYTEQLQIDGGKMDKFVTYSQNPGEVQSYYNATDMPEGKLAQQYTLCDNFFHSAFGGSFLNHIWLIAARSPEWKDAPEQLRCKPDDTNVVKRDNQVTPDGYVVNTSNSVNKPHPAWDKHLAPNQTMPTIGDRLNDSGIKWAWYAGGWNDAMHADNPNGLFMCHHQPFVYFENYKDGSDNKSRHLKDEVDFLNALKTDTLPNVCFIKPFGADDEHPSYSSLMTGQKHVDSLVRAVMGSKYWDDAVIIIAYDEHGGRWDHVAPPKIDRWGPGSRVPCIVISKYAKKKFVDHTQYETVSILKLIESRYGLHPLSTRDSMANNMLNAFEF